MSRINPSGCFAEKLPKRPHNAANFTFRSSPVGAGFSYFFFLDVDHVLLVELSTAKPVNKTESRTKFASLFAYSGGSTGHSSALIGASVERGRRVCPTWTVDSTQIEGNRKKNVSRREDVSSQRFSFFRHRPELWHPDVWKKLKQTKVLATDRAHRAVPRAQSQRKKELQGRDSASAVTGSMDEAAQAPSGGGLQKNVGESP
jgi:hypothetical protein